MPTNGRGPVSLYHEDHLVAESGETDGRHEWTADQVRLIPGVNTFELRSSIEPKRAPGGYLRTFGLSLTNVERAGGQSTRAPVATRRGGASQTGPEPAK